MPDTPAAELRSAAARMRQLASEAASGPWGGRFLPGKPGLNVAASCDRYFVRAGAINVAQASHADAEFIASMHPLVALAGISLHRVTLTLCSLCLNGEGGQCHTPGCALWLKAAPDCPLYLEPGTTPAESR